MSEFDDYKEFFQKNPQGIFVFGSNLAGRHGLGAAKTALEKHGAIYGEGIGLQGNSYAIPTKDRIIQTLPLEQIRGFVEEFLTYSYIRQWKKFFVTRIGCGLAGYKDEQIAPLFKGFSPNCIMPKVWMKYYE